jgi:hypothetical protein
VIPVPPVHCLRPLETVYSLIILVF